MRVPEITYRFLYPKDVSGPTFELFTEFVQVAGVAAELSLVTRGIAKDKVLCLTNLQLDLRPSGGESALRGACVATTPGGVAINLVQDNFPSDADQRQSINWSGEVYVGGMGAANGSISATGTFSGAVQSGSLFLSVFGVVIPRGNIAPF